MVCQAVLQKHASAIMDLSFHEQETNLLMTCAFENYLYIWDIREPRRPVIELQSINGAYQVKKENGRLVKWVIHLCLFVFTRPGKGRMTVVSSRSHASCRVWTRTHRGVP
jgi:hypothetical protein